MKQSIILLKKTKTLFLTLTLFLFSQLGYSQCSTVYAVPGGTGIGTKADPAGLYNAITTASDDDIIRVSTGTYEFNVEAPITANNLTIEGGYDQFDDWSKTSEAGATTINREIINPVGFADNERFTVFTATGISGLRFQDLTISTNDVPADIYYGASTYGVYLNNCSDYSFVRVQIFTGDAGQGRNGANGSNAIGNGSNATDVPENGHCDSDSWTDGERGFGGDPSGNGGHGGSGSNGGYRASGSAFAANGDDGEDWEGNDVECAPNRASNSGINNDGNDGDDGCNGDDGDDGTIGTTPSYAAYFVTGGQGTAGRRGDGGGGGGGGSGGSGYQSFTVYGTGAGGGGGGGGGAGGFGAFGAKGGGGSFCLYLYNNGTGGSMEDCNFVNGAFGIKGIAGTGGTGTAGGAGRAGRTGQSCFSYSGAYDGGDGGNGGTGGDGGNGGTSHDGLSAEVVEAGITNDISPFDIAFDLAGQDIIIVTNPFCLNQDVDLENLEGSTDWTFGDDSSPSTASDEATTSTVYSTEGFKDITTLTDTYSGFLHPVCSAEYEAETETSCNSYFWPLSGDIYFVDSTHIFESTTAEGCLRVDTLHLIITTSLGEPIVDVAILDTLRGECSISAPIPPTATDVCGNTLVGTTLTVFPIEDGDTTVVSWVFDDLVNPITTQEQIFIRDSLAPRIPLIVYEGFDGDRENGSIVIISDYTVAAGQDRIVMICLGQNSTSEPTAVSYAGLPATLAHGTTNGSDLLNNIYYVTLPSDDAITGDVVAVSGTEQKMFLIASDYEFVDQDDPIGNVDSTIANDPSIIIEGHSGNKLLEFFIINDNATINQASGQTQIDNLFLGGSGGTEAEASFYSCYGGLNTMAFTATGPDEGLHNIVELNFGGLPELTAECSVDPEPPLNGFDNCSGFITPTTITSLPVVSDSVITWVYDDGGGNLVSFDQTITITDEISPSVPFVDYDLNEEAVGSPATSQTFEDFIVPAGDDRVLVLFTSKLSVLEVPTIMYGEVPAIFIDSISNLSTTSMYYIPLGSGDAITEDLVATSVAGGGFHFHAASFNNIDQTTPIGDTDKDHGVTVELDITASAGNKLVDYFIHNSSSNPSALSGQSPMGTVNAGFDSRSSFIDAVNGSNQLEYAGTGDSQYYIGMELVHAKMDTLYAECEVTPSIPIDGNDNCSGAITPESDQPATIDAQGTTVITWTYADNSDNQATFEQVVIIDDVTDPIPDDITDVLAECEVTELIAPGVTDNCGDSVVVTNDAILPLVGEGTTTVTWTFDDQHGNVVTATQDVIIDDVTAPIADPISDTLAECEITELIAPTGTDNCGGELIITNDADLPISGDGTTTVTWTLDDGNGNTTTLTQDVIIDDVTDPVLDEEILDDITSLCQIDLPTPPAAIDNCAGTIAATTLAEFPITDLGTTVITWIFDDGSGNIVTQDQNLIIEEFITTTTTTGITIAADQADVAYAWIDCNNDDALIPGEESQDFTPTENGDYAVILIVDDCMDTSDCVQITSVGMVDQTFNLKLILFPNPATNGSFSYRFDGEVSRLQVIDLLGRNQLIDVDLDTKQINCSNLESGKYIVIIETDNNQILKEEIIVFK